MTVRVRRSYVDGRQGQMHLRMAGPVASARPPLICIHMSPMTGRVFEAFLGAIGEDRRAIAFDTPGFGMSDPAAAPPRIEDYALDILSGIEALGIEGPVDLMGYHTGSMTSVAIARQAPERVRRIIMVSAPIFPPEERAQFNRYYAHRAPDRDGQHLIQRWKGFVHYHQRPGVTLEDVADVFRDALMGGRIEWWGHRAAFEYELADNLARVTQPVLILNTGDDLDVQTRRAEGLAARGRILEVPGWGHGFLDQHTGDTAALARAFLDAPDAEPFVTVAAPASALGPRFPVREGSFAPDAGDGGAS